MKKHSESGAVVIEATLSLSFFMFAIVTLYTMFHVCLAQARLGAAVNATAKELSQYSYVYALTGANDAQSDLASKGGSAASIMSDQLSDVSNVFDAIGSLSKTGMSALSSAENKESFFYYLLNAGIDQAKGMITGELSRGLIKKHLGNDADGFLKGLGVKNGLKGLDFSKSRLFDSGKSDEIILNVQYKVSVVKLLNIDLQMNFELCAKTRGWVGE